MCRLKRGSAFVALDCFVALTGMNQPCYTAAAAAAAPCWAGSFRVRGSIAAEATGAAVRQGAGGDHARLLRKGCRPPLRGHAAAHHARKRARPPALNRWRAQRAAKDGYASSARAHRERDHARTPRASVAHGESGLVLRGAGAPRGRASRTEKQLRVPFAPPLSFASMPSSARPATVLSLTLLDTKFIFVDI